MPSSCLILSQISWLLSILILPISFEPRTTPFLLTAAWAPLTSALAFSGHPPAWERVVFLGFPTQHRNVRLQLKSFCLCCSLKLQKLGRPASFFFNPVQWRGHNSVLVHMLCIQNGQSSNHDISNYACPGGSWSKKKSGWILAIRHQSEWTVFIQLDGPVATRSY